MFHSSALTHYNWDKIAAILQNLNADEDLWGLMVSPGHNALKVNEGNVSTEEYADELFTLEKGFMFDIIHGDSNTDSKYTTR